MLRYKVEAQRWMEGINSAVASNTRNNPMLPFVVLSQILTIVLCIVIILVLGLKYLLVGLVTLVHGNGKEKFVFNESMVDESPLVFDPIPDSDPNKAEKEYYREKAQELNRERIRKNKEILERYNNGK